MYFAVVLEYVDCISLALNREKRWAFLMREFLVFYVRVEKNRIK
jgi:hypothetical protein